MIVLTGSKLIKIAIAVIDIIPTDRFCGVLCKADPMKLVPPTLEQIDVLMPFVRRFEKAGFSAGKWEIKEGHFPWFNHDEAVTDFIKVLYDNNWITSAFNWTEWKDSAKKYVDSPKAIRSADAVTIQKLFTTHVRSDRFCEGHLASMFESGHILALLHRLQEIREEMIQESGDE